VNSKLNESMEDEQDVLAMNPGFMRLSLSMLAMDDEVKLAKGLDQGVRCPHGNAQTEAAQDESKLMPCVCRRHAVPNLRRLALRLRFDCRVTRG
jgi:hypothetical protein